MLRIGFSILFLVLLSTVSKAQEERKKVQVISREVEGEIRTQFDTLYGDIKVLGFKDYYITSIQFKAKGEPKQVFSADDVKKFRQVVPFPDRPAFLVDEVYYESRPDPSDPYKKYFFQIDEWK